MDQHNREVMEMEDFLEQYLSEVHEDHQIRSASKTKQLSSRFQSLLAARDQVIHQLVDKEDLLKKELQNKSRSEERLIEEKEGLLTVCTIYSVVWLLSSQFCQNFHTCFHCLYH